MNLKKLTEDIKQEEGFRDIPYTDHLGNWTIGWGHLIKSNEHFERDKKYSYQHLEKVLNYDLNIAVGDAKLLCSNMDLPDKCVEIVAHMCFQLGKPKTAKFKKMFEALRKKDYINAGFEMEDSQWAKQTPQRAMRLSERMKSLKE